METGHAHSSGRSDDPFALLKPPLQAVLRELGFTRATDPQVMAIKPISRGENVLLVAPTGQGKTEACILPVLNRFLTHRPPDGISLLYITPLRALNRDLLKRLRVWGTRLGFTIEVRHGDTARSERRKQALKPPDLLITTPETLQAILPGTRMRRHLKNVRVVIVDEIHELAEDRRGVQLSVALERLRAVTDIEYQRIGISATVNAPETVGAFLVGTGRPLTVIQTETPKKCQYFVERPVPGEEDYDFAQRLYTSPEVASRILRMKELVDQRESTLIFVNSRQHAEMLGLRLAMLDSNIAVHHGSLSREERHRVEDAFKEGTIHGIVCTSTLELGIDIGAIDRVVQYLSPRQVTPWVQRVGRSGHQVDRVSDGIILTASPDDTLEALTIVVGAQAGQLEATRVHEKALDVLAHQLAGLVMDFDAIALEDAYQIIRRAYPYRDLAWSSFVEVAEFVVGLRVVRQEGSVLTRRTKTRLYYYENLSTIPDERRYPIIDVLTNRRVGVLGEEFVLTKAHVGLNFICRGLVWKIVQITEEGEIYVTPVEDPLAAIPGWDGEILPTPFKVAADVGALRRRIASCLASQSVTAVVEAFVKDYPVERHAVRKAVEEIRDHLEAGAPIPSDTCLLVEGYGPFAVVHGCFGEAVNRTLGYVFDEAFSETGVLSRWWNDGYRILLEFSNAVSSEDLQGMAELLQSTTPATAATLVRKYVDDAFPFAYSMKFVAQRFGALPRGIFMGEKKLLELPHRFRKTPIYTETLREASMTKLDVPHLQEVFEQIHQGAIEVRTLLSRDAPTSFAYRILNKFAETPEMMAPETEKRGAMERMKMAIERSTIELFCLSCGIESEEIKIGALTEKPCCPRCGSQLLASFSHPNEYAKDCVKKRLAWLPLDEREQKTLADVRRRADVILAYGKTGVIALQVHGIGPQTAARILAKMHYEEEAFYRDLLEAKIKYLQTRPYWADRPSSPSTPWRGGDK
jgi:ATP-dependent Lhr-like helicase